MIIRVQIAMEAQMTVEDVVDRNENFEKSKNKRKVTEHENIRKINIRTRNTAVSP